MFGDIINENPNKLPCDIPKSAAKHVIYIFCTRI